MKKPNKPNPRFIFLVLAVLVFGYLSYRSRQPATALPPGSDLLLATLIQFENPTTASSSDDEIKKSMDLILKADGTTEAGRNAITQSLMAVKKAQQTYEPTIAAFLDATCDPEESAVCSGIHVLLADAFTGSLADSKNVDSRDSLSDSIQELSPYAKAPNLHETTQMLSAIALQFAEHIKSINARLKNQNPEAIATPEKLEASIQKILSTPLPQ